MLFTLSMSASAKISPYSSSPVKASDIKSFDDLTSSQLECAEIIIQGLMNYESQIDIERYGLSYEQFVRMYWYIIMTRPDLFWINPRKNHVEYMTSGIVKTFLPTYLIKSTDYKDAQDDFDEAVEKILDGVEDEWSDLEKILYVHDYIAANSTYDTSATYKDTAYGALVKQKADCEGYSRAFLYIMNELGIECLCVSCDKSSLSEAHTWNMVKCDGNWYHVDVTWDDPTNLSSIKNQVHHDYFMVSDAAIKGSRGTWYFGEKANKTTYDDSGFWHNSLTAFVYDDDSEMWYGSNNSGIIAYSFDTSKTKVIYSFGSKWLTKDGKARLKRNISAVVEDDDIIYFNSNDTVYAYSTEKGTVSEVKSMAKALEDGQQIYTLYISDDRLVCGVGSNYSTGELKLYTVKKLD